MLFIIDMFQSLSRSSSRYYTRLHEVKNKIGTMHNLTTCC